MNDDLLLLWSRRLWRRIWRASRRDLEVLRGEVQQLRCEMRQLQESLAEKAAVNELIGHLLRQRRMLARRSPGQPPSNVRAPAPNQPTPSLSEVLDRLRGEIPAVVTCWERLLAKGRAAYAENPRASCSISGNEMAELFACFVTPYVEGTVLDVGCGSQPVPVYLEGVAAASVVGIDPQPGGSVHPFAVVQGLAEDLPWPAQAFDTVIAATSLDHVLLLDRALDEIARVLKPNGRFLVWLANMPGAQPYNPHAASVEPVDDYHLFHLGSPWFDEMLIERFLIEERLAFLAPNHSVFLALRPRPARLQSEDQGRGRP